MCQSQCEDAWTVTPACYIGLPCRRFLSLGRVTIIKLNTVSDRQSCSQYCFVFYMIGPTYLSILLQQNISKLLWYFWSVFRSNRFSARHKVMLRCLLPVFEASAHFFIYVELILILFAASQFYPDKWASKKSRPNLTKRPSASFTRCGRHFLHAVCNLTVQRVGQCGTIGKFFLLAYVGLRI